MVLKIVSRTYTENEVDKEEQYAQVYIQMCVMRKARNKFYESRAIDMLPRRICFIKDDERRYKVM
jgi:hypothetical protein